jgi:hypothetical protein
MKTRAAAIMLSLALFGLNQNPEGWELFNKVTFEPQYFEEAGGYFDVPTFNKELKALEKTEIVLSGYNIPLELDSVFRISKSPFSSCFFCGGAGPETVAEIRFVDPPKHLAPDGFIKVKGRLQLNGNNIDQLNFILLGAEIIK